MAKNLSNTRTRKRGMVRKVNHSGRIQSKKTISKSKLKPGMMVTFRYDGKKIYDENPFVLFLYKEKHLMHCINLNYLQESIVQNLFKNVSKVTSVEFNSSDDKVNKQYTGIDIKEKIQGGTGISAKMLYDKVIKPKLLNIPSTNNCYRTYDINKILSFNLVAYKLDVIEEEVREDTDITPGELSKAELHKAILQDEHDIETDNER